MTKTNEDWSQQYMQDPNKKRPNYRMRKVAAASLIGAAIGTGIGTTARELLKSKGGKPETSGETPAFVQGVEYMVMAGDTPSSIDAKAYPDSSDHLENGDKILASEPRDEFHNGGLRPGDKVVFVGNTKFKSSDQVQKVLVAGELKDKAPFVVPIMPNNGEIVPKEYGMATEIDVDGHIKVIPPGPPPPPPPNV